MGKTSKYDHHMEDLVAAAEDVEAVGKVSFGYSCGVKSCANEVQQCHQGHPVDGHALVLLIESMQQDPMYGEDDA